MRKNETKCTNNRIYAEDVSDIFDHHAVTHHPFADDMQGQCGGPLNDASVMASRLERCCSDVSDWCARKRLQLNADKSEMLWFGSASQLRGLRPDTMHITINQSTIKPATVVRDLRVLFDGELSMRQQVSRLSQTCFYHLTPLTFRKSATRP